MIMGTMFIVPFKLLVFRWSAGCVLGLRERCGWPAVPAYAVGVLLNNFSVLGFSLSILMAPNMLSDPDYKLPDDKDLRALGHRVEEELALRLCSGEDVLDMHRFVIDRERRRE